MGLHTSRLAAATAMAAALSMAATPLAAAELNTPSNRQPAGISAYDGYGTANYDRWRGRGWRHRDRRIDAGDVLAGVLIIGGIAAIASAASNSNKRERERERVRYDERYDDRPEWREDRAQTTASSGRGIDNAVNMCVEQIERGPDRIASVDNASRTGDGWRVSGQLDAGGGFSCWIDNQGRIRDVDIGDGSFQGTSYESQHSDDYSARARADIEAQADNGSIDGDLAG